MSGWNINQLCGGFGKQRALSRAPAVAATSAAAGLAWLERVGLCAGIREGIRQGLGFRLIQGRVLLTEKGMATPKRPPNSSSRIFQWGV